MPRTTSTATSETKRKTATKPASKPKKAKPSKVEEIKKESRNLRGTIAEELAQGSDKFSEADKQLLKFHGSYQQEDRDARKNRSKTGIQKHYMFMVRCKMPGGRLTSDQYLSIDQLADQCGNGTIRFTSRQGIQLHGVLKKDLKETIQRINDCLLTTLGACGDVERNVMCCPAPLDSNGIREQLQGLASKIADHLAPRTHGYHEIWLNGHKVNGHKPKREREPIYGKTYLPRKFKTGICLPEDNCIDIYTQDLGFLAIVNGDKLVGFNVLVGGGSGMTHGNAATFPCLAKPVCYIPVDEVVQTAEAVIKLFRDHGNRSDRKRARLKYVVEEWGVTKLRKVLKEYAGHSLKRPLPVEVNGFESHTGWHPQGDGQWFYGISIESGRVKDEGDYRLRTSLREIIKTYEPTLRVTPLQDLLLCDLPKNARAGIRKVLVSHGVTPPDKVPAVKELSLACPAIPTCGLAISEAERALPSILDELQKQLKRLGLSRQQISIRMTGCPNGCVRPYQSDIGIVGRSGNKYTIFLGGNVIGDRLNQLFKDLVPREEIVPMLTILLKHYKKHRRKEEGFGDFCYRVGQKELMAQLPETSS